MPHAVPRNGPDGWPGDHRLSLVDFDAELLRRAAAGQPDGPVAHAIGIRTPYPAAAFDLVVVTSRLGGIWPRWGDEVRAEAYRIGRAVRIFPADAPGGVLAAPGRGDRSPGGPA